MSSLATLLLLSDSRLPAGGHAHSGGLAPAVEGGSVHDLPSLEAFLLGRLSTAGLLAASVAARAAELAERYDQDPSLAGQQHVPTGLRLLDAELEARMAAPAARTASRAQGRGLLRVASDAWPSPLYAWLVPPPHLAVACGVVAYAAGCGADAASVAALGSVTAPASAAVRLLGLDPMAVTALLARLAATVDEVARRAAEPGPLPAASAPLLDLLAHAHQRAEVRLFAS
ncbi:MAG: urease accessory protein UreF [Mycobacteriales bacterium]